jgi:anti-sigma B factor antagonist
MFGRNDKTGSELAVAVPFGVVRRKLDARTSVVCVEGELDLSTAPQLKWMLLDALDAGHSQLVVDLSQATFMDSTALGVLIGVNRNLDVGARLAIVCARDNLLKIFELSGMDGAFAIFPALQDALVHAQGSAAETG